LVYGAEVVLPPEVTMGSLCVQTYDEVTQDQLRCEDIDLVDESRWQFVIKNIPPSALALSSVVHA
jgi:hypothetical protein